MDRYANFAELVAGHKGDRHLYRPLKALVSLLPCRRRQRPATSRFARHDGWSVQFIEQTALRMAPATYLPFC